MRETFSTIQKFRQEIEFNFGLLTGMLIVKLRQKEKRIMLMLFFCFSLSCHAQDIKSRELRDTLFNFLIKNGDFAEDTKTDSVFLIICDVSTLNSFDNQKVGIFKFGTLTTHSYFHLLIKDKRNFTIIDMRQPYENIVKLLTEYFDRYTNYSKEKVLGYLKTVTELYVSNVNAIPWKIEE